MDKHIHIICLDIPFPADYGGAIDQFYKLEALQKNGWNIILHCFQYANRIPSEILNIYCKEVHYYPRLTGLKGIHHSLPYIVYSRQSNQLLDRLNQDQYPILFEGVHTTYLVNDSILKDRKKILRVHNIEANYYQQLANQTHSFSKKLYFYFEANRLFAYEKQLHSIDMFLSISTTENTFFKKLYPQKKHHVLPAFHAYQKLECNPGKGSYCIFHGNLAIPENICAVEFLAKDVFKELPFQLIITGKKPSSEILNLESNNIKVIANPSDKELDTLLKNAQIHVLISFQNTGFKLKLIHSLFTGRHVIANKIISEGSGLESLVHIANDKNELKSKIEKLMNSSFTYENLQQRKKQLSNYENSNLASKLNQWLLELI